MDERAGWRVRKGEKDLLSSSLFHQGDEKNAKMYLFLVEFEHCQKCRVVLQHLLPSTRLLHVLSNPKYQKIFNLNLQK